MNKFNLRTYLKNNPLLQEDLRDVADEIEAAGIYLDDGILGGVGSGGGGYYDWISDKISTTTFKHLQVFHNLNKFLLLQFHQQHPLNLLVIKDCFLNMFLS
jgi:hypothetical protein